MSNTRRIGLRPNYQTRRIGVTHADTPGSDTYPPIYMPASYPLHKPTTTRAEQSNHGRRNREQWRSCGRSSRCPRARTSPSRTCPSGSSAVGVPPPTRRRGRPSPSATSRSTSPPSPTPGSSRGPCSPPPNASTRYRLLPVLDPLVGGRVGENRRSFSFLRKFRCCRNNNW
jgi:hypothetical protein